MSDEAAPRRRRGEIGFGTRRTIFLVAAAGLGALLVWGLAGLPDFGDYDGVYGLTLNRVAVGERHATDLVTAVNFDYRAFDTLGEEFILFAAVRVTTLALVGPIVLLSIYITAHGQLTPGGGFQGGVIAATALLLVFLGGEYTTLTRVRPMALVEVAKAAGAAGFVLIGLAGLIAAGSFLENFLPLGTTGELLSAGTIPLLSVAVGLEVTGGLVMLLSEFLDQTLLVRRQGEGPR